MSAEPALAVTQAAPAPQSRTMSVCYLVFRPDSLTYTIGRGLSWGTHPVLICVADPDRGRPPNKIERLLCATPGIRVTTVDDPALPTVFDRLIVQIFPRLMERLETFAPLAERARAITLVSAGDRSRSWRQAVRLQWLEARALRAQLARIDRVLYKDGLYRSDIFGLFKPRDVVGFDAHSQFLHDQQAFRAIHAPDWDPEAPRPVLANFLGSRDPEIRRRVVDAVRGFFQSGGGQGGAAAGGKTLVWHEYSDAEPGGLGPAEFVDVLTRSDFTLCPPGYSLITHRPIEALLRGSIPVLNANELDLYAVGLQDGTNCIAVEDGRWGAAMARLARIPEADLARMRRAIRQMVPARVDYRVLSARMCARLGVTAS